MTKSILLVDDDVQFRNLVVPILKDHGYRVVQASNGVQALQALQFDQFDAAIVDGRLPDLDGLQLLEKLRKHSATIKLVYVSAYWRDAATYSRMANEFKTSLILHKPIMPLVLGLQIESLFLEGAAPAADEKQARIASKLEEMTAEYKRSLPDAVSELKGMIKQAQDEESNKACIGLAITASHKLRGTAGSFGMAELGVHMGTIEDNLNALATEKPSSYKARELWGAINLRMLLATNMVEPFRLQYSKVQPDAQAARPRVLYVTSAAMDEGLAQSLATSTAAEFVIVKAEEAQQCLQREAMTAVVIAQDKERALALARQLHENVRTKALPVVLALPAGHDLRPGQALYNNVAVAGKCDAASLASLCQELVASTLASQHRPIGDDALKVLLVDDDANFTKRTGVLIQQAGAVLEVCNDSIKALDMVEEISPDLLLLDVDLPGISGFDICKSLRAQARWSDLPIVFVTVKSAGAARATAYGLGASDFITKPIVDAELSTKLDAWLDKVTLTHKAATVDGLTGLKTHSGFARQLNRLHKIAQTHKTALAVVLLDINGMNNINQVHGYAAGDQVLSRLGKLMNSRFDASVLRGRVSGQQFALAFPDHDLPTAIEATGELLNEFQSLSFAGTGTQTFQVSCRKMMVSVPATAAQAFLHFMAGAQMTATTQTP